MCGKNTRQENDHRDCSAPFVCRCHRDKGLRSGLWLTDSNCLTPLSSIAGSLTLRHVKLSSSLMSDISVVRVTSGPSSNSTGTLLGIDCFDLRYRCCGLGVSKKYIHEFLTGQPNAGLYYGFMQPCCRLKGTFSYYHLLRRRVDYHEQRTSYERYIVCSTIVLKYKVRACFIGFTEAVLHRKLLISCVNVREPTTKINRFSISNFGYYGRIPSLM